MVLNLDKLYDKKVHGPSYRDWVLYSRVPEYKAEGQDLAEASEQAKDERFVKLSANTFNSPTNIRRVFLASDKVGVQYLLPYIKNGQKVQSKYQVRSITDSSAPDILKGAAMSLFMNLQGNVESINRDRVSGSGFGALHKRWVCSNVEEIFFDYTPLLSDINREKSQGVLQVYTEIMSGKNCLVNGDFPLELLMSSMGLDITSLMLKFPRLKRVGLIQNLSKIIDNNKFGDASRVNLAGLRASWVNQDIIAKLGGVNIITNVARYIKDYNEKTGKSVPEPTITITCRSGIYMFDKLYLEKLRIAINKEITNEQLALKGKESLASQAAGVAGQSVDTDNKSDVDKGGTKSDIELALDEILETKGAKAASTVFVGACIGLKRSEITQIINEMSPSGRSLYGKLVGIN